MSTSTSSFTGKRYGLKQVCQVLKFPRSTVYAKRKREREGSSKSKPGPRSSVSDEDLLKKIRYVIETYKFTGEGHRKVRARLRREHRINVSCTRVLRLMRENRLLSPHRSFQGKAKAHDRRITTDAPNDLWATDATKIMTLEDGWVNFFGIIDHWNSEILGWHLCKKGDRHAALEALRNGIRGGCGGLEKEIARGIKSASGSRFYVYGR